METPGTIPPKFDPENVYDQSVGHRRERYTQDEVYKQAFGYSRVPYPGLIRQSQTLGISPFGKVRALKGSFKLQSELGTELALPTKIDGWQLPGEPIISIVGGKKVKETELNRGERTQNVLEEINLNNYRIRLRGVIISEEDDIYPERDVRKLREILEKPGSLEIENALTSIWNINRVALVDWDLAEVEGYVGAQAFVIDMLSDQDFELELIDDPERL